MLNLAPVIGGTGRTPETLSKLLFQPHPAALSNSTEHCESKNHLCPCGVPSSHKNSNTLRITPDQLLTAFSRRLGSYH